MNNNENFNVLNPLGAWNNTRLYRAQVIYTQAVSLPAYISCPFVTYGGSLYYSTGFDINYNELQPTQGLIPSQDPAWLLVNITGGGGGLPTITSPTGTILVTNTLQNPNIDLPQSVATTATPTFAGLNLTYTTQERSILKKMLSLFTTDDVQAVFNASIRTGVLTANRVVTIPDGDSVTVVATTAQAGKVVSYIGADGIQRFVTNGGGGLGVFLSTFFTYTYSITPPGLFPLVFNLLDATSIIPSPPTGWLWTVTGGTLNTDYSFTNGTTATSQNPQITFNVPPNLQQGYTLILLPSSTAVPPISYLPYSIQIPPQPLPLTTGTYSVNITLSNPPNAQLKPYWNYSATDVFVFQGFIDSYLKCSSITIQVINFTQVVPTFSVTGNDVNLSNKVNSTPILPTSFPALYDFQIQANMFNSDGITTTIVRKLIQSIGYYVPALYIQNANLTAPTFDITSNQVMSANGIPESYQAGLSISFGAVDGQQVLWVAYPQVFTIPPPGLVVFEGDYTGTADLVSLIPTIQVISGITYNIYGYQINYTGYAMQSAELYLELIPNIDVEPNNLLLKTQSKEVPKTGLFQSIKRLFGAKQ